MQARPLTKSWEYQPEADDPSIPENERASFTLHHLSAEVEDRVAQLYIEGRALEASRMSLLHGLSGWNNIKDDTGAQIEFRPGQKPMRCHPRNLDHLEQPVRLKVAGQIFSATKITAGEGD